MSEYSFTARDARGKVVKSTLSAESISAFYAALRAQSLYCLSYRELEQTQAKKQRLHKMKVKELIVFCRKMGTMMGSGLGMTGSFDVLYQTAETPQLRELYLSVYENIRRGMSLSQAMVAESASFPPFLVNMVESGEASGNLDSILFSLASHYESENKLMHKVKSATIYPAILLFVSIGVVILLFTFVLPRMMQMFSGAELPLITQIVMSISDFLVNNWATILLIVLGIAVVFLNSSRILPLKRLLDYLKLHFPIVRNLNRTIYSSRFARSMSILYSSGIPLITALRLSSNILGNSYVDRLFMEVMQDVSMGGSLSVAIEKIGIFDPLLSSMIRIGEESGSLDTILSSISDYYDIESENAISRMIAVLEPIMLVVLATVITFVLAAVMLPIYSMYSSLL